MRLQTQHQDWGEISEIQFLSRKLLELTEWPVFYAKYIQGGPCWHWSGSHLTSSKDKDYRSSVFSQNVYFQISSERLVLI